MRGGLGVAADPEAMCPGVYSDPQGCGMLMLSPHGLVSTHWGLLWLIFGPHSAYIHSPVTPTTVSAGAAL